MSGQRDLLAVDGGGTNCRLALLWQGERYEVLGPGANVTSDFDGAVKVLRDCLLEVAGLADVDVGTLHGVPAYLGLAGVVDADIAADVADALPFGTVLVEEDRPAALAGALGDGPGCVVSIGTGSFLGRRMQSGPRFIGGHGLVLGDEASGAWLGRRALARALSALDGMSADSDLCKALRTRLGGAAGVIAFARDSTPGQFAAMAPEIVASAGRGDEMATRLMSDGADYIARGLQALGWRGGEPVCLLGGLGREYAQWLPQQVQAALVPPQGTALDGAVMLAARLARDGPTGQC